MDLKILINTYYLFITCFNLCFKRILKTIEFFYIFLLFQIDFLLLIFNNFDMLILKIIF